MLGQGEHKILRVIEERVAAEDPDFAEGLGTGVPRRPCGDRRWRCVGAGAAALLVLWLATIAGSVVFMTAGLAGVGVCGFLYRREVRRAHRLSPQVWRRAHR